jgi:farnesyl-diphosphate farnesyltransferase
MPLSSASLVERLLGVTSATFGVCIARLDPSLRQWIGVSYLLARTFDTLEDCADLPGESRAGLLRAGARMLEAPERRSAWLAQVQTTTAPANLVWWERTLLQELEPLLAAFAELPPPVTDRITPPLQMMAVGMAEFALGEQERGLRGFASVGELMKYCYCVAGVVGSLLTDLFAYRLREREEPDIGLSGVLHSFAVNFGTAMQLSNILKNVGDDARRGVSFLPRPFVEAEGLPLDVLIQTPEDARAQRLVLRLIQLLVPFLRRGVDYAAAIPDAADAPRHEVARKIREFLCLQLLLVSRIVEKAMAEPATAFYERTLQPRGAQVEQLAAQVAQASESAAGVRQLLSAQVELLDRMWHERWSELSRPALAQG